MTTSLFKITPTPPTSIKLEPGQEGKFSFTVESLAAPDRIHEIMLQALLIGDGGTAREAAWLIAGPRRTLGMPGGKTETVTIIARPTPASPHGENSIKLVIADRDRPNDVYADSPPVACDVSAPATVAKPPRRKLPWWLIPAVAGGLLVVGGGALAAWRLMGARSGGPLGLGQPCASGAAACDQGLLCVTGVQKCLLAGGAACKPAQADLCASGECESKAAVCAIPFGGACRPGDQDVMPCPGQGVCDPATKTCLANPGAPPKNLAAGKPATQSSTLGSGDAARAVDGVTDGNWNNNSVSHTSAEAQAWWQVDLGALTDIREVVLYNRTDCCGDRLADFDVQFSSDGLSWRTEAGFSGPAPVRNALATHGAGRFVRVRLRGTNYLSLAEVQIFAPRNLAAGKPATQSSTGYGGDAARAVDDNPDGNFNDGSVTHTELEAQAWWQVDLGAAMNIGEVVVYNRTDCCSERLADLDVLLSPDGASWQPAASLSGSAPVRTALAIHGAGRFVRVRLHGTNFLSLAEVRVFAP